MMATMTKEQIEQKNQQLAEKVQEMKAIYDDIVEAGAIELSEEDLNQTAGGRGTPSKRIIEVSKALLDRIAFEKEISAWSKKVEEASGPHPETDGGWCY